MAAARNRDGSKKITTGKAKAKVRDVSLNTILGKKIGRTTGEIKGILRASKPGKTTGLAKGKNKDFAKNANKATLPSAAKSRRASVKEASVNTSFEKHPLVRNAGEASSENKYRGNRGKPVPVKPRGGMRGGGLGGLNKANR